MAEAVRGDAVLRERARRRLRAAEKLRLGAEIIVTYALVRRRISALPLPELLTFLRRGVVDSGAPASQAPDEHVTAVRLARATTRLLHRLPGDTRCLTQSLVLAALLARRGIGSKLLIAVVPGQAFEAHAWVEHGGVPVLPAEKAGFQQLAKL
ncbi:MAG: lasso peptide biosynthesis B2 protein [Actinomycetota bacterium]|nr:lasso peptide biosynthesis B2 protein [Actinomycetota bacterium]